MSVSASASSVIKNSSVYNAIPLLFIELSSSLEVVPTSCSAYRRQNVKSQCTHTYKVESTVLNSKALADGDVKAFSESVESFILLLKC